MASNDTCWSDLPLEIQQIICEKLVRVEDYIRFGAVSNACRGLVWLSLKKVPPNQPPLLVPSTSTIPIGSNHGWLIETKCISGIYSISLFNPFLTRDNVIQLPSLTENLYLYKAVLSHNPRWTRNYEVMLHYRGSRHSCMLLFRYNKAWWDHVKFELESPLVSDMIYYKEEYYAIGSFGMYSCNTSHKEPKFTKVASPPPVPFLRHGRVSDLEYLVESLGELMCVSRERVCYNTDGLVKTVRFRIFMFRATEKDQWIELKKLSGEAIFLGRCSSLAVGVLDFPQRKPNHIYFSDNDKDGFLEWRVFNMEDASFHSLVNWGKRIQHLVQPTIYMMDPETFASQVMIKTDHKRITESQKSLVAAGKSLSESKKILAAALNSLSITPHCQFTSYLADFPCMCCTDRGVQ